MRPPYAPVMGAMDDAYADAYDAIAIKEVLVRAVESRAAAAARARERIVEFGMRILEQVELDRAEGLPALGDDDRPAARARLLGLLTDLVLAELRALRPREKTAEDALPDELLARHLASTFVQVLEWWEESPTPVPAREANDYFRSLVLPALDVGF